MKNKRRRLIPLIVTVGQVAVFPYYVVWLKEVSLTFTLFAWLFAAFSFAAAWGYHVFQSKPTKKNVSIPFIYAAMGFIYIIIGQINYLFDYLPYAALLLQLILGFLQGYFRAWHIEQTTYRLHAVHHYLMVGATMIGLSFVHIISPAAFIAVFGSLLCVCGFSDFILHKREVKSPFQNVESSNQYK